MTPRLLTQELELQLPQPTQVEEEPQQPATTETQEETKATQSTTSLAESPESSYLHLFTSAHALAKMTTTMTKLMTKIERKLKSLYRTRILICDGILFLLGRRL